MSSSNPQLIQLSPTSPLTLLEGKPVPLVELSSLKAHQRVTSLPVYSSHSHPRPPSSLCLPASCHTNTHAHTHTPEDIPIRSNTRGHTNAHWWIFQLNATRSHAKRERSHRWSFQLAWHECGPAQSVTRGDASPCHVARRHIFLSNSCLQPQRK